jgi:hypothetical protein
MTDRTNEELTKIEAADELEIASLRRDGTYGAKYHRYSPRTVGSVLTPEARSSTILLVPRSTSA